MMSCQENYDVKFIDNNGITVEVEANGVTDPEVRTFGTKD